MLAIAGALRSRCPGAFSHLGAIAAPAGAPELSEVSMARSGFIARGPNMGGPRQYGAFVLIWLASALQALSAADLVLDCDRLSEDARLRATIGARLAAEGLAVDLADIAARRYPDNPRFAPQQREIEQLALRQLAGAARGLVAVDLERAVAALDQVSEASRALLEPALAALRATSTSPSR